jgi:hypothetical protein
LAFSYWIDNLGFVTEGKLAAIFIKPSLGVSNWPVIYFINYMPKSSLALFNTAPPAVSGAASVTQSDQERFEENHLLPLVLGDYLKRISIPIHGLANL